METAKFSGIVDFCYIEEGGPQFALSSKKNDGYSVYDNQHSTITLMVPQDYDEDAEGKSNYDDDYDSFDEELNWEKEFRGCAYDDDSEEEEAKRKQLYLISSCWKRQANISSSFAFTIIIFSHTQCFQNKDVK